MADDFTAEVESALQEREAKARSEERERCARACEDLAMAKEKLGAPNYNCEHAQGAWLCAAAIREGKEP